MRHEIRGAIAIVVMVTLYCSAVYFRRASKQPVGGFIAQMLGEEAGEILKADAIALVPEADGVIEIWPKGAPGRTTLPNRLALAEWLCGPQAPSETSVVILRNIPLGRGKMEKAASEGRLAIEALRFAPIRLECTSRARFYSVEIR